MQNFCHGLTPGNDQIPHSPLLTPSTPSSPSRTGEKIRSVKAGKLMDWYKGSLVGKIKTLQAKKTNQGINSLLPMSRQVFSRPQESRVSSHITVTWEDKHHHSKHLMLLLPTLYTEHYVIWYGTSFWLFGVICPSCVSSQFPLHLWPPHERGNTKSRKKPWLCVRPAKQ